MRVNKKVLAACVAAITAGAMVSNVCATEPVVKGPEAVHDWYEAGRTFVEESKNLQRNHRRAKNVILFVGDGMGVSTVTASRILDGQLKGRPGEENRLFFETLPYLALSKTYSWDQQTSDSAPTMTAMVTGYKAREGMLSVNHTTKRFEGDANVIAANSLETILEQAAKAGKDTGVVHFDDGHVRITADLPKKVDWDQKRLAEITQRISANGDDPSEYVEISYRISETKFNAWPESLKSAFAPARTLKTGKPGFRLALLQE